MSEAEAKTPRRRRRKEARPGEIIEAGIAEFAAKGFAGTKLEHVAQRAGVSKGTIYHYFGSKETLFREAFRARFVDSLRVTDDLPTMPDGPILPALRTVLRLAFEGLATSDHKALLTIMLLEGDRFPDLIEQCRTDLMNRIAEPLRALLERGVATGELAPGAYQRFPVLLFTPGVVLALFAGPTMGLRDPDAAFEAALDLMFEGLTVRT
ncbi:MAG: TetR/AcrR family transcriptional regulator [Pseudomonadota bacterium]